MLQRNDENNVEKFSKSFFMECSTITLQTELTILQTVDFYIAKHTYYRM